jgi:hypothetical protein
MASTTFISDDHGDYIVIDHAFIDIDMNKMAYIMGTLGLTLASIEAVKPINLGRHVAFRTKQKAMFVKEKFNKTGNTIYYNGEIWQIIPRIVGSF